MPVTTLFLYIVVVALLGYLVVWVLGQLAPGHPPLIDNMVWVVVVMLIVVVLLNAFGVSGGGPTVPRLGR